jgi:uroporphyrin-III C-methyltransferase
MAHFYLVGAGPGDADLLTLRAAKVLALADIVLYDRLVSGDVLRLVGCGAQLIPVGKGRGDQHEVQERIFQLFDRYGKRARHVVRLKGGDPLVYGRGAEEWAYLVERGHEVEYVPGLTSALAVPGLAGIPPTFRGLASSFAVVTGHGKDGAPLPWADYAKIETLIVLMGVARRAEIAQALLDAARSAGEPVAFIESGSTSRERVVVSTLGAVARGEVEVASPAVMVIGAVASLRDYLCPERTNWEYSTVSATG